MKDEDKTREQLLDELRDLRDLAGIKPEDGVHELRQAIARARNEWEQTFDALPDLVAIIDNDMVIRRLNRALADRLGLSFEEAIGRTCYECIHGLPEPPPSCPHPLVMADGKGRSTLCRVHRFDGDYDFTLTPVLDDGGEMRGCVLIAHDVTERMRAESALRESESRLRTVLETVKEGIIFSDEAGHFEVFNSEMENITGYTMEEANDTSDFDMLLYPAPEARARALEGLSRLHRVGDSVETETVIRRKDGTPRHLLVSTTLVSHLDRRMFLSACRDITRRKRAEEEREKLILELREALARIKTLRGLIPICAWCKKVRDDKGYWKQVEEYIREHSEADFTHSICRECKEKLEAEYRKQQ